MSLSWTKCPVSYKEFKKTETNTLNQPVIYLTEILKKRENKKLEVKDNPFRILKVVQVSWSLIDTALMFLGNPKNLCRRDQRSNLWEKPLKTRVQNCGKSGARGILLIRTQYCINNLFSTEVKIIGCWSPPISQVM